MGRLPSGVVATNWGAKHVDANVKLAKDESSILSTSILFQGFSLKAEAFCF